MSEHHNRRTIAPPAANPATTPTPAASAPSRASIAPTWRRVLSGFGARGDAGAICSSRHQASRRFSFGDDFGGFKMPVANTVGACYLLT